MRTLQADYKQLSGSNGPDLCVMATGGGAFKYYDRITDALGIEVMREEEMECLIIGMYTSRESAEKSEKEKQVERDGGTVLTI